MQLNSLNSLFMPIAIVLGTVALALTLVMATQTYKQVSDVTAKNSAVQGCFEVAKGNKLTSGESTSSNWTVQESTINMPVVSECLTQKGY